MALRDFNDSEFSQSLVRSGLLQPEDAERALRASDSSRAPIERTILELSLASETAVYEEIAEWLDLQFTQRPEIDSEFASSLSLQRAFMEKAEVVPISKTAQGEIVVVSANPRMQDTLDTLAFHFSCPISPIMTTRSRLRQILAGITEADQQVQIDPLVDAERLRKLANDGPIVELTNDLLSKAVSDGASDVHIEMMQRLGRIRFRKDGVLEIIQSLSSAETQMLVSRLKVLANLNISEKRLPQDGRAKMALLGRDIDFRISTLPSQFGESLVIRILDQTRTALDWDALGFDPEMINEIKSVLKQPNGLFLVAGPTGSGKTTTLYTALETIKATQKKIVTVEDPIEYAIEDTTQVQVHPEIDLTFARALRAILRQDPDVILVGEIRDRETAEIAVRAALVGRLVLSTVHTNDSLSAIDRLLDLGIPNYLIGSTLRGVLSQRLARRVCHCCAGSGCSECTNTGRLGRTVVSELLVVDRENANEISKIRASNDIGMDSRLRSFQRLSEDATRLAAAGVIFRADAESVVGS